VNCRQLMWRILTNAIAVPGINRTEREREELASESARAVKRLKIQVSGKFSEQSAVEEALCRTASRIAIAVSPAHPGVRVLTRGLPRKLLREPFLNDDLALIAGNPDLPKSQSSASETLFSSGRIRVRCDPSGRGMFSPAFWAYATLARRERSMIYRQFRLATNP
jgi:hypothetical protein